MLNRSIEKFTKPDLLGRIQNKLLRRVGRSPGANYLASYGWQQSKQARRPIDAHGKPIPWYTYPTISVLQRVVLPHYRVFEYGCGNSSLWWAEHADSVVSVEHHPEWAATVKASAPNNLNVLLRPQQANENTTDLISQFLKKYPDIPSCGVPDLDVEHGLLADGFFDYANEITNYEPFDVIVVDGMARSLTAWMAAHHLKPDGFIVFDNSDRWQYNVGYQALFDLGFGRVDFWGPGPVNNDPWCSSIFYRTKEWSRPLIKLDPGTRSSLDWVIEARKTR